MINKIITLKNKKEYVIAEECDYQNEHNYFACEVVNGETTENFAVLKIFQRNDKKTVQIVKDDALIKEICSIRDDKLK